jgi:segregation and condensation protein A
MTAVPDISLPRFEGPLDLLLSLIRKHELEIVDIPIAEITRQYLDYLHRAEALNIDLGAEFVYMAALLIELKSRCLLPSDPQIRGDGSNPRQDLVRLLLDRDQVRQGAEFLKQRLEVAEASWSKSAIEQVPERGAEEGTSTDGVLNLLQVLRLAQQALATARSYELVTPEDPVGVAEMMEWMEERMAANPGVMEVGVLLAEQADASHRMALFLAILEMAKSTRIRLEQEECFGPISLSRDVLRAQPCHNIEHPMASGFGGDV